VVISAFSACRESSRVCCTTIGTLASIVLEKPTPIGSTRENAWH